MFCYIVMIVTAVISPPYLLFLLLPTTHSLRPSSHQVDLHLWHMFRQVIPGLPGSPVPLPTHYLPNLLPVLGWKRNTITPGSWYYTRGLFVCVFIYLQCGDSSTRNKINSRYVYLCAPALLTTPSTDQSLQQCFLSELTHDRSGAG